MRKLIYLLPLLMMPAFTSAAHDDSLQAAAYRLEANAGKFYSQVSHLPGNWRLKAEAHQFAMLSNTLARETSGNVRPRRLRRTLARLDQSYYELDTALRYAHVRGNKNKLRKRFRKVSLAMNSVASFNWPVGRLASSSTWDGYVWATSDDKRSDRRRRYRN